MEAEIGRGRLPSSKVSLHQDQSVLILNQNSAPCTADQCDSLLPLIQRSLRVKCIQEPSTSRPPDRVSSVPDLILLRPAVGEAAQELIQSCKEKRARASIIALLCAKWEPLLEDLPSVLIDVDDFLPCPFHESELLLRVKRTSSRRVGIGAALRYGRAFSQSAFKGRDTKFNRWKCPTNQRPQPR
jgi:hypothetical protein